MPAVQEPKMWVQALGQGDPLEEGMATHSSILAWRIPWRSPLESRRVSLGAQEWPKWS